MSALLCPPSIQVSRHSPPRASHSCQCQQVAEGPASIHASLLRCSLSDSSTGKKTWKNSRGPSTCFLLGGSCHDCSYLHSMHTYLCGEVMIWSKFGPFRGYYLVQVGVIIWSKFVFQPIFTIVSGAFETLSHLFVCFLCPIIWQFSKLAFFKKKKGAFFKVLCFKFNFESSLFMFAKTLYI